MASPLDPLRYGLRALEEMAREQASVVPRPPPQAEHFSPHPVLRPLARDGALLTLRLFSEADDDATPLVLAKDTTRRFEPIPPRAAALFEAHAAVTATEQEDALTMGFPLVTFVQQGTTRAAPLFSRGGARARWMLGSAPWKLPAGARDGTALTIPDALVLEVGDEASYTLHGGVWSYLFGLDGTAMSAITTAGRAGIGALVRAATRALSAGEDGDDAEPVANDPLGRDDLTALSEAATQRAAPSRGLRCHPHALAMLPPRGDPTSGLRVDLDAVASNTVPPRGPLAVYLGARAAPLESTPIFTTGRVPPTPSQLDAARAFEGTNDIVAVRGPPGCGKTALIHHVAAHTIVSCALGKLWTGAPSRTAPWPLVLTSTNNAAVDHALAPFVAPTSELALPVGIRLGNRRALAEQTSLALGAVIDELGKPGALSLPDARAAFEERAAAVRAFLNERSRAQGTSSAARRQVLELRAGVLREELARLEGVAAPSVELAALDAAARALSEHAEAAGRLPALHLEGPKASVDRARDKWARANERRGPAIAPVLEVLGLPLPFGDLDRTSPHEDIARQREAIESVLQTIAATRRVLAVPETKRDLAAITEELATLRAQPAPPPLDPGLYDAALSVRDAWARSQREALLPRIIAARDAARAEWGGSRGKPLPLALRELAPLFPVAGCTLLSMRASFPLEREVIDRLVIDEAAQCAPIYAVPALARARRAMLTGDTAQLPPVYTLDPHVDERLARGLDEAAIAPFRMSATSESSAQAVAEPRARTQLALTEHFRSQHAIVALASRWSGYTLDVRTPPSSLEHVSRRLSAPVAVVPVSGIGSRAPEGVVNEAEAARVVELVTELVADGVAPSDIAILTPFVGQYVRIERELGQRGLLSRGGILVSTVHRLQGGERRVVVFSVTATQGRHSKWLAKQPHLLHVATSRARDHLVVFVDPDAAAREPVLEPLHELIAPR